MESNPVTYPLSEFTKSRMEAAKTRQSSARSQEIFTLPCLSNVAEDSWSRYSLSVVAQDFNWPPIRLCNVRFGAPRSVTNLAEPSLHKLARHPMFTPRIIIDRADAGNNDNYCINACYLSLISYPQAPSRYRAWSTASLQVLRSRFFQSSRQRAWSTSMEVSGA